MDKFAQIQESLKQFKTVKYQEVIEAKWEYFRLIYKQEKKNI